MTMRRRLSLVEDARYRGGRMLLLRIVADAPSMDRHLGESGTGSGTGSGTK
jgi:hypothetical protein